MKRSFRLSARRGARAAGGRSRGQSLAEFALILPLLLTIVGATIDFARLYQAWIGLQAATRVAAEYVAANDTTSAQALSDARRFVCTQTQGMPGFQASALAAPNNINQCTQPTVTVPSFTRSTTAAGASAAYPVGSATVTTSMPFRMFFSYPLLTQNGTWTLRATESYSIVQGRT
jgi:Flp pilus assembly protein TadG